MRPIERIDKIIAMLKNLVDQEPNKNKTFGEIMEDLFLLMQNKYFDKVIEGNIRRDGFLRQWFSGVPQAPMLNAVLDKALEKEREETRVHVMLVEDDALEYALKHMTQPVRRQPADDSGMI